jgi:hypothetical protein
MLPARVGPGCSVASAIKPRSPHAFGDGLADLRDLRGMRMSLDALTDTKEGGSADLETVI